MESKRSKKKKFLLHLILSEIQAGSSPSQISKKHDIPKQNLTYYLRQLKKNEQIEKVGYGVWRAKKEVKKVEKAEKVKTVESNINDKKILQILIQNREGLRVKSISKIAGIPYKTVYKRLGILKKKGYVENTFPIWRMSNGGYENRRTLLGSDEIFELHDLSYVVRLIKKPDWWNKRKNYLVRLKGWEFKNIDFGKGGSSPYQQLKNEHFVLQMYSESIIIIARKRYMANNPYETAIEAISDVLDLLEWFCERFRFDFFASGVPHLEVRSNHFNRLNDVIANKVREDGNKFLVKIDERRKVWVDLSEPFGKEANYPSGQEDLERYTKDILLNKPMLPSDMQKFVSAVGDFTLKLADNQVKTQETINKLINPNAFPSVMGKKKDSIVDIPDYIN